MKPAHNLGLFMKLIAFWTLPTLLLGWATLPVLKREGIDLSCDV